MSENTVVAQLVERSNRLRGDPRKHGFRTASARTIKLGSRVFQLGEVASRQKQ
jgi:hypothetical protein